MNVTQNPNDARLAIDAVNRDFVEAFVRKDSAAISSLYTANGRLLPPGSDFIDGRAAIARYWQEAMKVGVRKLATIELEIHGATAHELGRYTIVAPDASEAAAGMYIVIWKHEAGAWKMHRDIWNTR